MNWEQLALENRDEWQDRFWSFATASGTPDACVDWHGYKTPEGYGMFYVMGKGFQARRLAWGLHNGELPPPVLYRTCANPGCILHTHMDPHKGRVSPTSRAVYGPYGTFPTVISAAEAVGVDRKKIRRWCQNGVDGWGYVEA